MQSNHLAKEWHVLQSEYDSYERMSLVIKLVSIGLYGSALLLNNTSCFIVLLIGILWLQDAIWKTFQSRIDSRLLQVEKLLADSTLEQEGVAYQFNSQFLENRLKGGSIVMEYLRQAIKPTIAFPHIVIAITAIIQLFCSA